MRSPPVNRFVPWVLPALLAACLPPARALAAADGVAIWDPCRTFIAEPGTSPPPAPGRSAGNVEFPLIRAGKRGVEVIVGLAPAGNREAETVARAASAGVRSIVFLPSGRHVEVAGLENGRLVLTAYTPERADAILRLLCFERAGAPARTFTQAGRRGP